jgi:hypothetical protein
MKVEDGIHAAEKALWNCKAKLGDGPPPSATPEKVGPFVSYCTTNYIMCANKILALAGGAVDNAEPKHCLPPQGTDPKTITLSTIAWLKQRPETYGLDTDDTIGVAFAHIWPCH